MSEDSFYEELPEHDDLSNMEAGESEQAEEDEDVGKGSENDELRDTDEEGMSFLDRQVNDAIQKRREEKEIARAAGDLAFIENVDEKLGEDFEDTPWVPPSIEIVSAIYFTIV